MNEARPGLVVEPDPLKVFLSDQGAMMCLDQLTNRVKRYIEGAHIGKVGACYLFRYSMATLMLENGADICYIQQMLGHVRLETDTGIYPHLHLVVKGNPHRHAPGWRGHNRLKILKMLNQRNY